jgi:hypothetical protein
MTYEPASGPERAMILESMELAVQIESMFYDRYDLLLLACVLLAGKIINMATSPDGRMEMLVSAIKSLRHLVLKQDS